MFGVLVVLFSVQAAEAADPTAAPTRPAPAPQAALGALPYDPYSYSNPLFNNGHHIISTTSAKKEALLPAASLPEKKLDFYIVEMRLERFLEELERHMDGITFTKDKRIGGTIRNVRLSGTIEHILETLTREFNLAYVIEGRQLILASKETYTTAILPNRDFSQKKLYETLGDMREEDIQKFVRYNPVSGNIEIKGPEQIVTRLEERLTDVEVKEVQLIKYGQADKNLNFLK